MLYITRSYIIIHVHVHVHVYMNIGKMEAVHIKNFETFFLGKVTALGVLCCFALFV